MVKKDARSRISESVGTRVTRRTVTRGIAWTTPVVAVAAAAPAFATSCEFGLEIDPLQSCKKANANSYRLVFRVTNGACAVPEGCTATITRVFESTGQKRDLFTGNVSSPNPVIICNTNNLSAFVMVTATLSCDAGGSRDFEVKVNQFTNNASTCTGDQFC